MCTDELLPSHVFPWKQKQILFPKMIIFFLLVKHWMVEKSQCHLVLNVTCHYQDHTWLYEWWENLTLVPATLILESLLWETHIITIACVLYLSSIFRNTKVCIITPISWPHLSCTLINRDFFISVWIIYFNECFVDMKFDWGISRLVKCGLLCNVCLQFCNCDWFW